MKKLIIAFIIITLTFSFVSADNTTKVFLDGKEIKFSVQPTSINGRTLVQLRPIFEALGMTIEWDNKTKTVTGKKEFKTITLQIDNDKANINGMEFKLDVPAKTINGSTMVPLRFVAETTGAEVAYDNATKTINIKSMNTALYNSTTLRADAIFKTVLTNDVAWVPANILGKPQLTSDQIKTLDINNVEELKTKINTLYDLIHFIQIKNMTNGELNKKVEKNKIWWEIPSPSNYTLKINGANCYAISELADYLLSDNYEIGFIHRGREDGGHITNYIKKDGKYYLFDLTAYRNDLATVAPETGRLIEYWQGDKIANIHETSSLESYIKYFIEKSRNTNVVITMYDDKFPIASDKHGTITYYYPDSVKYTILYDNPSDNVQLKQLSAPSMDGVY